MEVIIYTLKQDPISRRLAEALDEAEIEFDELDFNSADAQVVRREFDPHPMIPPMITIGSKTYTMNNPDQLILAARALARKYGKRLNE